MKWRDGLNFAIKLFSLATISIMSLIILQLVGLLAPLTDLSTFCAKEILRLFGAEV